VSALGAGGVRARRRRAATALAPTRGVERILAGNAWLVFAFLYLPIVMLVVLSFNDNRVVGVWGGASLRWYRELAGDSGVLSALRNSLIVAVVSTIAATALGTAAAIALERYRWRGRRTFDGMLFLPVIIPDVTMAVMMLLFFVQVIRLIGNVFGFTGGFGLTTIILSHIAFNISFVAIVVRARLSGMSRVLEEAAADLYASRWQAFRHVTLPLIAPGIAGGALLALTLSLDDVVITSFVSGPGSTTLPVYVFGLVRRGVTPLINAVSVLMLAGSMLLVIVSLALQGRRTGAERQRPSASPSASR
jgi:spermidine/putrescine transport system permease protein